MQTDLFGKKRYKVNLHTHTTLSDGRRSPLEVLAIYREAGYDAIAITDHWYYGEGGEHEGMTILSGAEYNTKTHDCREGVFHIVGVGMKEDPHLVKGTPVPETIERIRAAEGIVILAHPAWSLNTPEQILPLEGIDATEIYNTVSGLHMSRRPDSGLIVDMIGAKGRFYPLIAADDTHYYDGDECVSWIMVEAEDNGEERLIPAIREGKYYATQGPEVHLFREGEEFVVRCSPCSEIVFLSNFSWTPRAFEGEGLTEARYTPKPGECFIRAEVMDANGKRAWSQIIPLE